MDHISPIDQELQDLLYTQTRNLFHKIEPLLREWQLNSVYIAGGSFGPVIHDIDLFPVEPDDYREVYEQSKTAEHKPVYQSNNALTFDCNGTRVQFCDYYHPSLSKLLQSFDFAHIQVGALLNLSYRDSSDDNEPPSVFLNDIEVLYTTDYVRSRIRGTTWYTLFQEYEPEEDCDTDDTVAALEQAYPLSSLLRSVKYKERGLMTKSQYADTVIRILCTLIRRGFRDYNDFKQQLNAIDLVSITKNPYALDFDATEEDYDRLCMNFEPLMQLYHLLKGASVMTGMTEEQRQALILEIQEAESEEQE